MILSINKDIRDLKAKFAIYDIPNENHQLFNMYWILKMHKNPIKARMMIEAATTCVL